MKLEKQPIKRGSKLRRGGCDIVSLDNYLIRNNCRKSTEGRFSQLGHNQKL